MREWLLPLVLGAVAAGAMWALDPQPPPKHAEGELDTPFAVVHVLGPAQDPQGDADTVDGTLHLAVVGLPPRLACPGATLQEVSGRMHIVAAPADCPLPGLEVRRGACPCAGKDGHTIVEADLFVYTAEGRLLATNVAAAPGERSGHFRHLETRAADLEDPELPPMLRPALRAVAGLPVGGVATVHLPEHPHRDLVGDLVATVQVTALSQPEGSTQDG